MYMWCIWPRVLKCTYTFVVLFGTLWNVCIMMLKRTPITCDSRISLLTWERPQAHTITDTHTAHDGKHFTDPVTDGGPAAAEQMPHAPKVSVRAFYKLMRFSPWSMHGDTVNQRAGAGASCWSCATIFHEMHKHYCAAAGGHACICPSLRR